MAIQPLDLQTLFTQLDKVAKTQNAQREGVALQQSIQGSELQRKTEEHLKSVNEAQNTGDDGTEKVKDKGQGAQGDGKGKKGKDKKNEGQQEKKPVIFRDLSLGRNIDISL
jgi:hypothetical protein